MKNSITLVPDDLIVRVVKLTKDGDAGEMLRALEMTRDLPNSGFDIELVRRLIVISVFPMETLGSRDVVWMSELDKTRKALLGVWQAKVLTEAMIASWLLLVGSKTTFSDSQKRLYCDSLAQRITDQELLEWLIEKI